MIRVCKAVLAATSVSAFCAASGFAIAAQGEGYSDWRLTGTQPQIERKQQAVQGNYFAQKNARLDVGQQLGLLVPPSAEYEVLIDDRLAGQALLQPERMDGSWQTNVLEWAARNQVKALVDQTNKVLVVAYDRESALGLLDEELFQRDLARVAYEEQQRAETLEQMNAGSSGLQIDEGDGSGTLQIGGDEPAMAGPVDMTQFASEWVTVDYSDMPLLQAYQGLVPASWKVVTQLQDESLLQQVVTLYGRESRAYMFNEIARASGVRAYPDGAILTLVLAEAE